MAIEVFKGTTKLMDGVKVECTSRNHTFTLDEPKELGGTDTGMNPLEATLCALGACKCIVARIFAKAHRIDVQDFKVELEGDLDMDGFSGKNKEAPVGFIEIRSKIYIKSVSPKDKIEEYVEFIDKTCPVAATLVDSTKIITEFIVEG